MLEPVQRTFDLCVQALNWWPYFPDSLRRAWIVIPALAFVLIGIGLAGASAYYRFWAGGNDTITSNIAAEAKIAELRAQGNFSVEEIIRAPTAGKVQTEQAREKIETIVFAAPAVYDEKSELYIQDKALWDDGKLIPMKVMVPFQDATWKKNLTTEAERAGKAVDLRKAFRTTEYKKAFNASEHLVCLGLSSRAHGEDAPASAQHNESLAERRSLNLCLLVAGALGAEARQDYWRVSLGESTVADIQPGSLSEARQRTAVIIGVRDASEGELTNAIARMLLKTQVNHVDLSKYTHSANPQLHRVKVDFSKPFTIKEDPALQGYE